MFFAWVDSSFFCMSFFWPPHSMWKFLGQGLNLRHSSNPSRCRENARSLTCYATKEPHVVSICNSLMVYDASMYCSLFTISTSSLAKCLFKSLSILIFSIVTYTFRVKIFYKIYVLQNRIFFFFSFQGLTRSIWKFPG